MAQDTTWKGSTQRSALGQYSLMQEAIHLAPSAETQRIESLCSGVKEPGQNFFAKASTTPYHGVRVVVENNGQILMTFLVAGFINSDVHKPIKARRSSAFKVFINPSANITNRMPFNPHQF